MRSQRAPKTRRLQTLADQIVRTCPAMFFDIGSGANQGMPSKKIFLSRNNRGGLGVGCDYFAGAQPSWPKVRPQIIQCDTRDQARCEGQREIVTLSLKRALAHQSLHRLHAIAAR